PIWTELYAWAIQRRPIRRSFVIALVLGALGLALVVTRRDVPAPIAGHALAGDMLALLGGMALAGYLLIVRGTRASVVAYRVRIVEIVTRTYSWAFAALAIAALFWHESPPPLGDGVAWVGILAMALVSQLIGHTALNAALTDFSPSTVAMSTLLEPVAAAVLAALIFHESATPVTALGGLCILAAIGFAATQTPEVPPTTYADSFSGEGTSAPGVMKQR
ncbi:MAG: DMT family transporter, partial [Candidatus Eremiobacteraeota bacterium]|nr:DMT family transporter [Candidatus Eremiobacteraeota bacterium]